MGEREDAPIHQVVGLLSDSAPDKLARLRERYPEMEDVLAVGESLGVSRGVSRSELAKRKEVAIEGLSVAEKAAGEATRQLYRSIQILNRFEFFAEVVSVIMSSALVTRLAQGIADEGSWLLTMVIAILTLLASIATLIARRLRHGIFSRRGTVEDSFAGLVQRREEAIGLLAELQLIPATERERLIKSIRRANSLVVELRSNAAFEGILRSTLQLQTVERQQSIADSMNSSKGKET